MIRNLLKIPRRRLTPSMNSKVMKIAVEESQTNRGCLFYIEKAATLGKLKQLICEEFKIVKEPKLIEYREGESVSEMTQKQIDSTIIGDFLNRTLLEIVNEDKIIRLRTDIFHSDVKAKAVSEIVKTICLKKGVRTADELKKYVMENFVADFAKEFNSSLAEADKTIRITDTLINVEEVKYKALAERGLRESKRMVAGLIFLSVVQFSVLFYLTFFAYDWNVIEPIAYLTNLAIQIVLIGSLAFLNKKFGPDYFFRKGILKSFNKLKNREVFIESLKRRKKLLEEFVNKYHRNK